MSMLSSSPRPSIVIPPSPPRAGKHVLVEKPMALNLDEDQAMVDAAGREAETPGHEGLEDVRLQIDMIKAALR